MQGTRADDLPGCTLEQEQNISSGRKEYPQSKNCELDLSIPFLVENGKALNEVGSPIKPSCGENNSTAERFLGLADKQRAV